VAQRVRALGSGYCKGTVAVEGVPRGRSAAVTHRWPLAGAANYRGWLVANMAQTALPLGPGSVQPHSSDSEATTCSPRPDSPNQPASPGTGTSSLGSETAHSTHGPGCSSPRRTGHRGHRDPGGGAVYRSALLSSSDTTTTMSSPRSPTPQRCSVAAVKSLATRTDLAPAPGVRLAIFG